LDENSAHWGPGVWQKLHSTVEAIPCEGCRNVGVRVLRGFHDAVNVELGKKPLHPSDLAYSAMFLTRANMACVKKGECAPRYKCHIEKGCSAVK